MGEICFGISMDCLYFVLFFFLSVFIILLWGYLVSRCNC